jgi:hypothetical protein
VLPVLPVVVLAVDAWVLLLLLALAVLGAAVLAVEAEVDP